MTQTGHRMKASERREAVLAAAVTEFAARGLAGTSTEDVARRAGISQPYLFRLFPTKKALFLALVERCFRQVAAAFEAAGIPSDGLVETAVGRLGVCAMALIRPDGVLAARGSTHVADYVRRLAGELVPA